MFRAAIGVTFLVVSRGAFAASAYISCSVTEKNWDSTGTYFWALDHNTFETLSFILDDSTKSVRSQDGKLVLVVDSYDQRKITGHSGTTIYTINRTAADIEVDYSGKPNPYVGNCKLDPEPKF